MVCLKQFIRFRVPKVGSEFWTRSPFFPFLVIFCTLFILIPLNAKSASEPFPSIEEAHVTKQLAANYLRTHEPGKSIALLEPFVKKSPYDYGALQLLGVSYIQADRPQESQKILERAYLLAPLEDEPLMQFYLAWVSMRLGHFNKAYELSQQSSEATEFWKGQPIERQILLLTFLASKQMSEGAYERARVSYEKILALDPTQRQFVDYQLGILYFREGEIAKASAHWEKVYEHDPSSELGQRAKKMLSIPPLESWSFVLPVGFELFWDSNVSFFPARGSVSDKLSTEVESAGHLFTLRPTAQRYFFGGRSLLRSSYFFDWTFHFEDDVKSFDAMGHGASTSLLWYFTDQIPTFNAILDYSYSLLLLNKRGIVPHTNLHLLSVGFDWIPHPMLITALRQRHKWLNFYDEADQANDSRDGTEIIFGGTQTVRLFNYQFSLYSGYNYSLNFRRGRNFEHRSNEILFGLISPRWYSFQLLGSLSLTWRDFYQHFKERKDFQQIYSGRIEYAGWDPLSLYFQVEITHNKSKVTTFDFIRGVFSSGATYRF